jgi:putative sterol carrier protein
MGDPTAEFFDGLGALGQVPALKNASGTLRFDVIEGKRTTRWLVTVKKGDVTVSRRNAKADCVVRGDRSVFEAIASGRQNAMAAVLRGAVDIEGDSALLVPFQRLFPGGPRRAT